MHTYSVDESRFIFIGYMGIAAFGLTVVLNPVLKRFVTPFIAEYIPGLLGVTLIENSFFITVTLGFTLIFTIHNGFLWRILATISRGGDIPDLQGVWVQTVPTSSAPKSEKYDEDLLAVVGEHPHLVIGQTWTEMEVSYIDLDSEYWRSDSAAIILDDAPNPELICTFQSESYDDIPVNFDRGTVRLRYFKSGDTDRLVGYQYTDSSNQRKKVEFQRRHQSFFPKQINVDDSEESEPAPNNTEDNQLESPHQNH